MATAAAHRSAAAGVAAEAIGVPQRRELLPQSCATGALAEYRGTGGKRPEISIQEGGVRNGVEEGMDGESRSCLAVRALFFSPAQSGVIGECFGQVASVFASLLSFCYAMQACISQMLLECKYYSK